MAARVGWKRLGSRGRFRYEDSRGRRIDDPAKLARIEELVIPPAWRDVRISPRSSARVQATGVDVAGRTQYIYDAGFRARQEQAKFDKLIRFVERFRTSERRWRSTCSRTRWRANGSAQLPCA